MGLTDYARKSIIQIFHGHFNSVHGPPRPFYLYRQRFLAVSYLSTSSVNLSSRTSIRSELSTFYWRSPFLFSEACGKRLYLIVANPLISQFRAEAPWENLSGCASLYLLRKGGVGPIWKFRARLVPFYILWSRTRVFHGFWLFACSAQ